MWIALSIGSGMFCLDQPLQLSMSVSIRHSAAQLVQCRVLEAWRSKSTTPAASPKKATALSPPSSPPSAPKPWPAYGGSVGLGQPFIIFQLTSACQCQIRPHLTSPLLESHLLRACCARNRAFGDAVLPLLHDAGLQDGGSSSDVDEYDDDDDPGFLRLDVVGQEAALGCEWRLCFLKRARGQCTFEAFRSPPHPTTAGLAVELGQFSEASGQRDVAYYQPPKVCVCICASCVWDDACMHAAAGQLSIPTRPSSNSAAG